MSLKQAAFICLLSLAARADDYPLILRGKVVMRDGSAVPKQVSIERICSDSQGDTPGPLTNKNGEYIWRIQVDPMRTRACRLEAVASGYTSSSIEISALNGFTDTEKTLPDLVLSLKGSNPMAIVSSDQGVPSKALPAWKAAMKAVDNNNLPEAASKLQDAVNASPKFALGWHTLGIVNQTSQKLPEAKDAYQHAIEADPKMLAPYVTLARVCVRLKDWPCASKASEGALKLDSKKMFPEVNLHLAAARFGTKDYDGALASIQDALKMEPGQKRAEYVWGRILEAKGDTAGAKDHMTKYLQLDPNAADVEIIKAHVGLLGKPEATSVEPDLESPVAF